MIGLYAFISFLIAALLGAWWQLRVMQAEAMRKSKWCEAIQKLEESSGDDVALSEATLDAAIRANDSNSTDPVISDSPWAGLLAGKMSLNAAQVYRELLQESYGGGKNMFKAGRARIIDDDLSSLLASVAKEEEPQELQVVSLSLGLCTRTHRLKKGWRPPSSAPISLIWFEVEPAVAADRRRTVLSIPTPAQLELRSVALSLSICSPSDLLQGLKGAGYSSLAPTIFVLEGVLSRWPLERALSFLSAMRSRCGPGSRLLASIASEECLNCNCDPQVRLGSGSLMEAGRIESTGWGRIKLSADLSEVVRQRYRRELNPRYPLFSSPKELSVLTEVEHILQASKI